MPRFSIVPMFDKDMPEFEQWQKDSGKVGSIYDLCRGCSAMLGEFALFGCHDANFPLMEGEPADLTYGLIRIEHPPFDCPFDLDGWTGAQENECELCGELLLPEDE